MDRWLLYLLILLFIGCVSRGKKEVPQENGPFAPLLKQKIEEFIHYVDSVYPEHTKEMFYAFNAKKVRDTNYLTIKTDYYYDPRVYKIGGYTFLDSNLVVFENAPGPWYLEMSKSVDVQFFVPVALLDTTKLIRFEDSIPGYQDGRKGRGEYEPLMYRFQLIGQDSLVLLFSGWW